MSIFKDVRSEQYATVISKRKSNFDLLETTDPITIKILSEKNASIRTIKYDLDNIHEWLNERKQKLNSKRSCGIWLDIMVFL